MESPEEKWKRRLTSQGAFLLPSSRRPGRLGNCHHAVFSREALKTASEVSPRGLENPKGSQNSAIKQTWVLHFGSVTSWQCDLGSCLTSLNLYFPHEMGIIGSTYWVLVRVNEVTFERHPIRGSSLFQSGSGEDRPLVKSACDAQGESF